MSRNISLVLKLLNLIALLISILVFWWGCVQLIASSKGYEECVKLLLEHGADPNKSGTSGIPFSRLLLFVSSFKA